ncbi:MAG: alpha-glucan family phosphorylase [Phaeodactylibacter xiamenensis]|uniref:glycogen phosphorylase n=1 Tax=Phaeodactylibacter xiamenensis TaxID=1524460 RepID=A0A098RZX7_9BACT|nr:alpha-glucan family phosphorylase [Phaeodactylibacter xiamenensis]KGE85440.1 alpha-glucan phosphorylase [Phaeodactylibacter xiamenensis]MCR9053487.1 alpha-glucan family phosphorylase [bacterium]
MIGQLKDNKIQLKRIFIESTLPDALQPLKVLANNIWWSWNKEAIALFEYIDKEQYIALRYNPVALLEQLSPKRAEELVNDKDFLQRLQGVVREFEAYIAVSPEAGSPKIAYFSMEYGLHISLRLYSGGLGVLAGDYLKEASDDNSNMIAVGLLYRYGYFEQAISLHGDQINNFPPQKFTKLPIQPVRDEQGEWVKISVGLKGRMVYAKVWELKVGRISLYLLDTDIDENEWHDRSLTHQLYGGDNEHRLRQEILLGIGGIRALRALGYDDADIYHCNEGHAAFLNLERLKNYIQHEGMSYEMALETVRSSSLFTTHTPVPAGHDYFHEDLLREYLYSYAAELGIEWSRFVALGKIDPHNHDELFSMSHLAIRLSQEVNGVSELHGAVSQKMFKVLYPGYHPEELHLGYVTNSVHYPTWIAKEWNDLYLETFGNGFLRDQSNKEYWRKIHNVPSEQIMGIRRKLKARLLDYVRETMQEDLTRRGENPRSIFELINAIKDNALVIGFARRFATYKRAHLLFTNLERLSSIVSNSDRPIIFLFAGKAHPADGGGQGLIKHIIDVSKRPEFRGKVIFLENYNMEMAKLLVQGVDIWLNTPTRPKEASGTSGMKAALNGVMNFSVLDGWWAEGYRPDAGWALPLERTYDNQDLQNELDAESIYNILEFDILPTYYEQDENGISEKWVSYIRQIIAEVAPDFTMKRMLDHYYERFYHKLAQRGRALRADNYAGARQVAKWKHTMEQRWDRIELAQADTFDSDNRALQVGEHFYADLKLYLNGVSAEDVGVEVVFFSRVDEEVLKLQFKEELELKEVKDGVATYHCELDPKLAGVYEYGFRAFPKSGQLAHRQDLPLVKWL